MFSNTCKDHVQVVLQSLLDKDSIVMYWINATFILKQILTIQVLHEITSWLVSLKL